MINEFSASNQWILQDEHGEYDDWVEIYNDNVFPVNAGGLFVTDSLADGTKYRIPSLYPDSTTIQPKGYLLLWADGKEEQGVLHLGFSLRREGEQLGLLHYNGKDYIDSLSYHQFPPNSSVSRYPDGHAHWLSMNATPGRSNLPELYSSLYINEFKAGDPALNETEQFKDGNWIEIFNLSEFQVDLGGLYITNDLSYPNKCWIPDTLPQHTIIPPMGFVLLFSDNKDVEGAIHTNFVLGQGGDEIGLAKKVNNEYVYIDSLFYVHQSSHVSTGRAKDGVNAWTDFINPTPGQSNWQSVNATPAINVTDFKVFPNPVSNGILHFNHVRSVKLYNHSGLLIKQKLNTHSLNISSMTPGIYILHTDKGEAVRIVVL
jgi:hypothetical protein